MSYDKTLEVHCYEITTNDKALNEDDEQHIEIQLWCFDKKSNPCLLRVRDFPCFAKVELPVLISRTGHITPWNNDLASDMVNAIKNRLKKCNKEESAPTNWQYKLYHKLYYYSEKKSPFLLLIFNTVGAMYTTSQKCKFIDFMGIRRLELKFHEMNVDIFNKMFSIKDMGPTEKFTCKAKESSERISKPGPLNRPFNEYVIDWHSIMPLKEAKWISHPRVCSFDIEVYSHKHRCFPQKQSAEDVIFSISIVTQEFMKPETRKDIMIIIGPTMGQEGVEIHYAKDEYEVIEKFYEIIEREDPDVFTGYNIFGFDYDYMNVRIEDVGLEWKNIGRLKEKGCEVKNKSWQSSAFGMMNMYILDCPGRISIDMMSYIKREHKLPKYSLDVVSRHFLGMKKVDLKPIEMFEIYQEMQVNIDNICKATGCEDYREATKLIVGDPDKYLTKKEQKRFLKIVEKNTKVVEYNVIDSYLVIQLFEKLNVWISLIELANIVRINPTDCFTRGQQKRCIAQIYHTAYQNDVAMTKRDKNPIYYNGGHVEKPKPGLWDCVMCFDFNSLYPSIMIAYNICFTTLLRDKHVKIFPKEKQHYFHIEQEEPVGWKPSKKDNFDYGEYEDCVNGEDEKVDEEEGEKKDTIHREYDIAFVNKNVKKGLLPIILENLLKERKKKKNDMKIYEKIIELFDKNIIQKHKSKETICVDDIDDEKTKKEFLNIFSEETTMKNFLVEFFNLKVQYGICDAQQLGLKISANSLYGFLGCQAVGEFSLIQAGMAVTGIGRQLIGKSAEYFEQNYGAITAYGDTDSVMVHIPGLSREEMDAKAKEMESDINGHPEIIDEKTGLVIAVAKKSIFPEPLVLEYEKGMYAIFMRKKMYIYMEIKNGKIVKIKGTDIDKIIYRGVMNARRDGCKFCTTLYERMVRDIFNGGTIKEVLTIILVEILKLLKLDLDIEEELTFIREMKSNYKSKTFSSAIYSELMKSIQRPINSGERFSYVIVNDYQCREKLGYKMRTYELFSEQWETSGFKYGDKIPLMWKSKVGLFPPEEIDCKYYITNKMIGPIDSLFYFSFFKVLNQYENVNYVPERRRLKPVNIGEPVAFVSQILEEYDDLIAKHGIKIMIPKIEALLKYVEEKM